MNWSNVNNVLNELLVHNRSCTNWTSSLTPIRSLCLIALCSRLGVRKLIDMGERVIDSDYPGEIGVALFNRSVVDFPAQWET